MQKSSNFLSGTQFLVFNMESTEKLQKQNGNNQEKKIFHGFTGICKNRFKFELKYFFFIFCVNSRVSPPIGPRVGRGGCGHRGGPRRGPGRCGPPF